MKLLKTTKQQAKVNEPLARYGTYGLHLIEAPSGKWIFAGTIPVTLCIKKIGSFGEHYGSPIFDTHEQGLQYFNEHRPDKK